MKVFSSVNVRCAWSSVDGSQTTEIHNVFLGATLSKLQLPRWLFACHCLQIMMMGILNSGKRRSCDPMEGTRANDACHMAAHWDKQAKDMQGLGKVTEKSDSRTKI